MVDNAVYFDSKTGQYRLNRSWSPAYSGLNKAAQRRLLDDLYDAAASYGTQSSPVGSSSNLPGVGPGNYSPAVTGDMDLDTKLMDNDQLNFEIQRQASTLGEFAKGQTMPKGWQQTMAKALDNKGGRGLIRVLDVASRPIYGVAESIDSGIKAVRGESERPGYEALPPSYLHGKDAWRNKETGEVEIHPEWGTGEHSPSNLEVAREGLEGFREGLTGREKTTFGEVLRDNDVLEGKPAAVAGFALDVGADPLTYVTFGTSNFIKKGGMEALDQAERQAVETAARTAAQDALEDAAKGTGRQAKQAEKALATGEGKAWQKAIAKGLDEELANRGLTARPVKEVVDDIDSAYSPYNPHSVGKERIAQAVNSDEIKGIRARTRRMANATFKADAAAAGVPVDKDLLKEFVDAQVEAATEKGLKMVDADIADEIATREALKLDKQLDIKFMGKTVASSERAGKGLAKGGAAMRNSRVGRAASKGFRTNTKMGETLHRIQRANLNVGEREFTVETMGVRDTFKKLGLTKKEREKIARAIELDDTKGLTAKQVEGFDYAKAIMKQAWDREVAVGAANPAEFKSNYLYHVYRNPEFSRGIGSWVKPVARGPQKFETLQEAAQRGANPLTDIADILAYRIAKSHRVSASQDTMNELVSKFGIDLSGTKITPQKLRGLDNLVEAQKIGGPNSQFAHMFKPGIYFDQDTAAAIAKMHEVFSSDEAISKLGQLFDTVQARLKFLQTAPNPGFHIRNTMSDTFMNFLDGVTNPRRYTQASNLVLGEGGKVKAVLRNGDVLDGSEIIQAYDSMGLRAGYFHADAGLIPEEGMGVLRGSNNIIRGISEKREDIMRMAHFIDAIQKQGKKGMRNEEIYELAAKRVKKYNFDYQDLTKVEQKFFRRAVPFYTFMRKNVPVMMETFFTQPGKMIVPTKAQNAMASFMGQDNRDEPLPGLLNMTPQWIGDKPGIELQSMEQGTTNLPTYMQPDMPYNQLQELFGGFAEGDGTVSGTALAGGKGLLKELTVGQTSPLFRGPAEFATGKDMVTGADKPQGVGDLALSQFPVGKLILDETPLASGVNNDKIFFQSDPKDGPTYTIKINGRNVTVSESVANYFTGMGFRKATPERMRSELRRRQDTIEALLKQVKADQLKKAEEEWRANLPPGYEGETENYGF